MTNRDFCIASNKFFYYAMNFNAKQITYPSIQGGNKTEYIPEFFEAFEPNLIEHLLGKWRYLYEEYGCHDVIMRFYAELDGENRTKMLSWINENYQQREDFGISI